MKASRYVLGVSHGEAEERTSPKHGRTKNDAAYIYILIKSLYMKPKMSPTHKKEHWKTISYVSSGWRWPLTG